MDDRVRGLLAEWRDATEHPALPPDLVDGVLRAVETPGFAETLGSLGRPAVFAGAVAAAVLVAFALGSVHTLAQNVADYAMSRAP